MFEQLPLFPREGSTVAGRVDAVFFFVLAVTLFFTALIALLVIVFAVRYRRRAPDEIPTPVEGSTKLEIFWTAVPLLIGLGIFVWGASVYFDIYRPPDDALEVYVVGRQWMWKVQHPDGQREINELHVPVGRPVKLILTSEDVIHSFYVPEFRIKQDALPGRYTYIWFQASRPDTYHLFCAEYCGTGHSTMIGTVVAMDPTEYRTWLERRAEGSPALEGGKLFEELQCITCHTGTPSGRGPVLEDIYRRTIPLQGGGTAFADDSYLRESILQPDAKVVAGFQPIMPTYQGRVTEEQLIQLIVYLKSLERGQTPVRTEQTEPPPERRTPKP
jgi:cytochrome c oxidase subunit II